MRYVLEVPGVAVPYIRVSRRGKAYTHPDERRWRDRVARAAIDTIDLPRNQIHGPVTLRIVVRLPRPRGHFFLDGRLRPSAPAEPDTGQCHDCDNLAKSIMDGLEDAGLFARGDGQVTRLRLSKEYHADAGVRITITARPRLGSTGLPIPDGPPRMPRRIIPTNSDVVWTDDASFLTP